MMTKRSRRCPTLRRRAAAGNPAKVRELEVKAMKETTNLAERMAAWEKKAAETTTNWTVLEPKDWSNFATKFEKLEDGSLLGAGTCSRAE